MEKRVTATEARMHLGDLLRFVDEQDGSVVIERSGRPTAVVISMEEYQRLKGTDPHHWKVLLEEVRTAFDVARRRGPVPDPVEMIRAGREERDEELMRALRRR